MGEKGKYAAQTVFNWDRIAEETIKVYEELLR